MSPAHCSGAFFAPCQRVSDNPGWLAIWSRVAPRRSRPGGLCRCASRVICLLPVGRLSGGGWCRSGPVKGGELHLDVHRRRHRIRDPGPRPRSAIRRRGPFRRRGPVPARRAGGGARRSLGRRGSFGRQGSFRPIGRFSSPHGQKRPIVRPAIARVVSNSSRAPRRRGAAQIWPACGSNLPRRRGGTGARRIRLGERVQTQAQATGHGQKRDLTHVRRKL
jgi:hypothetical protein